jgi:hypothetical protein
MIPDNGEGLIIPVPQGVGKGPQKMSGRFQPPFPVSLDHYLGIWNLIIEGKLSKEGFSVVNPGVRGDDPGAMIPDAIWLRHPPCLEHGKSQPYRAFVKEAETVRPSFLDGGGHHLENILGHRSKVMPAYAKNGAHGQNPKFRGEKQANKYFGSILPGLKLVDPAKFAENCFDFSTCTRFRR